MLDFVTKRLEQQVTAADMKVIRMIQGVTRWNRKRSEDLYRHSIDYSEKLRGNGIVITLAIHTS